MPRAFLALLLALPTVGGAALGPKQAEADALAREVQAYYERTKDLEARFVQTYTYASFGKSQTSRGTLRVKKPGKLRWDYLEPTPKTIVVNGPRLVQYEPDANQAYVDEHFDATALSAAVTFLLGKGRLEKEFALSSTAPGRLVLTPRQADGRVRPHGSRRHHVPRQHLPHEVVIAGIGHLDRHQLPRIDGRVLLAGDRDLVQVGEAVDLRRLLRMPPLQEVLGLLARTLHQHGEPPPDHRALVLGRDLALCVHHRLEAGALHLGWYLVAHLGRGRALLARVLEDPQLLEALLLHEGEQVLEVGLRLARQPDDERGAERQARHARAQLREQLAQELAVAPALHGPEQPVRAVLERHVEVLHDLLLARHHLDEGVGEVTRVRVVEPEPTDPVHPAQRGQQLVQARPAVEVVPPAGEVLRDERQLDHPVRGERLRLGHQVVDRARALRAAQRRDDAEGAGG